VISPDRDVAPAPTSTQQRTITGRRSVDRALAWARTWIGDLTAPRTGVEPIVRGTLWRVLGIWALGRIVNFALLWGFFLLSRVFQWGFGPEGLPVTTFLRFLSDWDAARYGRISQIGYPVPLPVDGAGNVLTNDWAFMPVFPWLERVVAESMNLPWQTAGVILSVAASAGATLVLFVLLRSVTTPRAAWWAVVLFTFGPLSFVFVLAYAESLFLLLLFTALLLARRRRYGWIAPIGVLLAFTRPGALALALALGILFLVRWFRRGVDPFPPRQMAGLVAAGGLTAIAGLSWTYIADAVTGTPHAYILTETAWWRPLVGDGHFFPLTPWFRFFGMYLGIVGIVLVLAFMAGFAWWVSSRSVRKLGVEVVAFIVSYGLYLFAVFLPQQSTFRLLLPISPILADERLSSTKRRRRITLGGALVLQAAAVLLLWTIGYP
jgi:hypothetical protein